MVDALCQTEFVDTSLQTALQEVFDFEGEHVIKLHAGFIEHTDADKTANQGVAFEEALGVFLVEGEKFTLVIDVSNCRKISSLQSAKIKVKTSM